MNPLKTLGTHGQSVWLDYIRRDLMTSGKLATLINDDNLTGMTSNPAIFEKAIGDSDLYNAALIAAAAKSADPKSVYEAVAIEDIQLAADGLRPVYDRTAAADGYVSLEVSPFLARDTAGTIEEGKRLWSAVNRPNLMIKVPATPEGIPAIQALLSAGINVNVTLLFAVAAYERVAMAYIQALETRVNEGLPVNRMASVASFFISRIDSAADKAIEAKGAKSLMGKVAIANAKVAYQRFEAMFAGPRWEALEKKGARAQRLLWASTSTKNPTYRDVLYVEELIGPQTVNTMPPATVDAFRDHGKVRNSLQEDVAGAHAVLADVEAAGISLDAITGQVLSDGLRLFNEPFQKLLNAVEARTKQLTTA